MATSIDSLKWVWGPPTGPGHWLVEAVWDGQHARSMFMSVDVYVSPGKGLFAAVPPGLGERSIPCAALDRVFPALRLTTDQGIAAPNELYPLALRSTLLGPTTRMSRD